MWTGKAVERCRTQVSSSVSWGPCSSEPAKLLCHWAPPTARGAGHAAHPPEPPGLGRLPDQRGVGERPGAGRADQHSVVHLHAAPAPWRAAVDPNAVLASAPPGYQLNVADSDSDLGRFRVEKDAGVRAVAAGRFEEASSRLSDALGEWRGPVLDDLRDFSFVDPYATALLEEKVAAHTARAEAEIACGRADGVIGELEVLTARHLYREPLWAQLITAYYVTERQSDALGAYRRLKTALAEGLGSTPVRR